jgi:PPOX class probable F420-dependent enzyme
MPAPFVLSPAIRALLAGPNTAHLSSIRPDGSPASHPVWVGLDADDHVVICTGRGTAKVRNVEHDPRVALSIVAHDDPYEEAMLHGTVIAVRNDDDLADMDALSYVYTGRPFPSRGGDRVTIVIELTSARHAVLPFSHTPGVAP